MVIKDKINKELEYYTKLPYTVIVEQWDDGDGPYWVARVLELPHCLIHADTPEDALKEIQEVKVDWIKSNLKEASLSLNPDRENIAANLDLEFPLHYTKCLNIGLK
jgi:Uncharacterised protein family (UPF0150).